MKRSWFGIGLLGAALFSAGCAARRLAIEVLSPGAYQKVSGPTELSVRVERGIGETTVDYYLDNTTLIGRAAAAPYRVRWDAAQTSSGHHTIVIKAKDSQGDRGWADVHVRVVNPGLRSSSPSPAEAR